MLAYKPYLWCASLPQNLKYLTLKKEPIVGLGLQLSQGERMGFSEEHLTEGANLTVHRTRPCKPLYVRPSTRDFNTLPIGSWGLLLHPLNLGHVTCSGLRGISKRDTSRVWKTAYTSRFALFCCQEHCGHHGKEPKLTSWRTRPQLFQLPSQVRE